MNNEKYSCKSEIASDLPAKATCVWVQDYTVSAWATDCARLFEVTAGTPTENGMCFCPFCGRELKESRYVGDIRDDHDDEYVAELVNKQADL
jgi:hypothetical protein